MTDYIKQYQEPRNCRDRDEAEGVITAYHMATMIDDDGAVRWIENGAVPPADVIEFWAWLGLPLNAAACTRKRRALSAANDAEANGDS